jgi:hypothetical protein
MLNKLVLHLAGTVLSIAAGMLILFMYWAFWPDEMMTIRNSQHVKTDKRDYIAGDRIFYTLDYCKTQQITATVTRAIVDGIRISYDTITNDLPLGCHSVIIYDLTIPSFLPAGIYHIEGAKEYRLNPIRNLKVTFRTDNFNIVAPKLSVAELESQLKDHDKADKEWQMLHSGSANKVRK